MDDTAAQPSKVRRFLRSYLGWALIGLGLIGLIQLVTCLRVYGLNSRELQAATAVEKVGGVVQFNDPPDWISKSVYAWLPVQRRIRIVGFNKTTPETLPAEMMSLSGLAQLYLQSPTFTDAGLRQLKGLTTVKTLVLNGTSITDDGLKSLEGLANLRILDLNDTKIGDSGIESLTKLKQLRWISLNGTRVTDEGLKSLKDLPFLRRLDLGRTRITGNGLEHLMEIKTLEILDLSPDQVTDHDLERFKTELPKCNVQIR